MPNRLLCLNYNKIPSFKKKKNGMASSTLTGFPPAHNLSLN